MDLNYTSEDLAFRDQVRAFLEAELPSDLQHKVLNHLRLGKDDYVRWHKILARQGWVAPGWPKEYGGPGWTPARAHSSSKMWRCAGVQPGPPYSFGQPGATQPWRARILCQRT